MPSTGPTIVFHNRLSMLLFAKEDDDRRADQKLQPHDPDCGKRRCPTENHRQRIGTPLHRRDPDEEPFPIVTSVAHTVGYAETAVFSRAFKTWTGSSPRSFATRVQD
jgi:AraC-like DNA-binding protein